jgi:hypothetical protein
LRILRAFFIAQAQPLLTDIVRQTPDDGGQFSACLGLGLVDGQTFRFELRFRRADILLPDHMLHALLEIRHCQGRTGQAVQEGEQVFLRDPALDRRRQDCVPRPFPFFPDGAVLIEL